MNSPPGEASATGGLVLLAQNAAWHSTKSSSQASPKIFPEALILWAAPCGNSPLNWGRYRGAALLFGQNTACSTEKKSGLRNWPTIWPRGLMSYTSLRRPAGRPGSSTGALLVLAQNKGNSTEESSLNAYPTISRRGLMLSTTLPRPGNEPRSIGALWLLGQNAARWSWIGGANSLLPTIWPD